MTNPNIQPIFTRQADVQAGAIVLGAAADYTAQNANNVVVYTSDPNNGGYVQRLRFKALGTCVATVARIYINNGQGPSVSQANSPTSLTGTPGTSGTIVAGNVVARVFAVDAWGAISANSAESANITIPNPSGAPSGNIWFNWNASGNCGNNYILTVGPTPNNSMTWAVKVTNANTYNMTTLPNTSISLLGYSSNTNWGAAASIYNSWMIGELSLPAITATATAGTYDIDYPLNMAVPPGYRLVVGLATGVANGWFVTAVAGKY